jgi:hypothetical protein
MARTANAFRGLIDAAADIGGSYYLTYHRYATAQQVERCHPRFREFLALKNRYDPRGVFQSDWYTHHLGTSRRAHTLQPGRASSTARLIAAAVVAARHDPCLRALVPPEAADWSARFLNTDSAWLLALVQSRAGPVDGSICGAAAPAGSRAALGGAQARH